MKLPTLPGELSGFMTTGAGLPAGKRIPALVLAGGVLLLALTCVRGILLLTSGPSGEGISNWAPAESEPSEDTAPLASAKDPFALATELPHENHPGPLVRELVSLLRDAGIETYQYRVTRRVGADPESEFEPADEEDWALPPEDDESETMMELELGDPEEILGTDAALTVAELFEWRIALRLEASYANVMSLLSSLQRSGRVWAVPRLAMAKTGSRVASEALLLTWTESDADEDMELADSTVLAADSRPSPKLASGVSAPAVRGASGREARDPFRGLLDERSRAIRVPETPHLGAISCGAERIAWLDGQRVEEGDRLGSWTIVKIAVADVTLRHESGAVRHVRGDHDLLPQR